MTLAEETSIENILRELEDLNLQQIESYFRGIFKSSAAMNKQWKPVFNLLNWNLTKQKFSVQFTKDQIINTVRNHFFPNTFNFNYTAKSLQDQLPKLPLIISPNKRNNPKSVNDSAFRSFSTNLSNDSKEIDLFDSNKQLDLYTQDCLAKSNSALKVRDGISASMKISDFNEFSFGPHTPKFSNNDDINEDFLSKKRTRLEEAVIRWKNSKYSGSIGLKEIACKVVEHLKSCNRTNYKDLSESILERLPIESENESKNIRRRIYDAINVLKAIDCLKQDNLKQITLNLLEFDEKLQNQTEVISRKIASQLTINKKKEEIMEKQSISNKILIQIIQKNKNRGKAEFIENKLGFPFLVVFNQSAEFSNTLVLSSNKKKRLVISSEKPLMVKGDYDILSKLKREIE